MSLFPTALSLEGKSLLYDDGVRKTPKQNEIRLSFKQTLSKRKTGIWKDQEENEREDEPLKQPSKGW